MSDQYGSFPVARLVVETTQEVWLIPLDGRFVVGREPGGNGGVVVPETNGVSKRHMEIYPITDETVVIRDLGTRGGTYLNGEKIDPRTEVILDHNDRIRLGPLGGVDLVFQNENWYRKDDIVCVDGEIYVKKTKMVPDLSQIDYQIFLALWTAYPAVVSTGDIGKQGWAHLSGLPPESKSIQREVQRLGERLNKEFSRKRCVKFVNKGYKLVLLD